MPWEFATATCIGSHHRKELGPTNGQDAYFTSYNPETGQGLVVVADGCGSSIYSEVGAQMGVRYLANFWAANGRAVPGFRHLFGIRSPRSGQLLAQLIYPMVERLRKVLLPLGSPDEPDRLRDAVEKYGFFTLNGVIFDDDTMVFFCIGDGVVAINGEVIVIKPPVREDPRLNNAPDYLGYTVLDPQVPLKLSFYRVLATRSVDSFLVASDGFDDLIGAEEKFLPGQPRQVGPVEQFWTDDGYFNNPQRLQQFLNLASTTKKKLAKGPEGAIANLVTHQGLLSDDTTIVVGRQIQDGEE